MLGFATSTHQIWLCVRPNYVYHWTQQHQSTEHRYTIANYLHALHWFTVVGIVRLCFHHDIIIRYTFIYWIILMIVGPTHFFTVVNMVQCSNCKVIWRYTSYSCWENLGSLWHIVIVNKGFRQCHCKWHCVKHNHHGNLGAWQPERFYEIGALRLHFVPILSYYIADKLNI